jgi:hypothetical protein
MTRLTGPGMGNSIGLLTAALTPSMGKQVILKKQPNKQYFPDFIRQFVLQLYFTVTRGISFGYVCFCI